MQRRPAIDLVAIRDRHPQHFARFDRQRLLTLKTEMGNSVIKLTTCSANENERSSTRSLRLATFAPLG